MGAFVKNVKMLQNSQQYKMQYSSLVLNIHMQPSYKDLLLQ